MKNVVRKIALGLSAFAMVIGGSTATASATNLDIRYYIVYYADASENEIVGESIIWCDGMVYEWGYPTIYNHSFVNDC